MTTSTNEFLAMRIGERELLQAMLPMKLMRAEPAAARMRWHSYRFMSALECTKQFARDYSVAYRSTFSLGADIWREPESEHFATLWQMRQAADDTQIPYPAYLEISFLGVKRKDPGRYSLPHLEFARHQRQKTWHTRYVAAVKADLNHWSLLAAEVPQFRIENDCGLPSQTAFRSAVCRPVSNVRLAAERVASYAIQYEVVPLAEMLKAYSVQERNEIIGVLKDKVQSGAIVRTPSVAITKESTLEGCFGWQPKDKTWETCMMCPLAAMCSKVAADQHKA